MPSPDEQILRTWEANVRPWTQAVRAGGIASRVAVTNEAVLGAMRALHPRRVLDLGCGEGWICHTLAAEGVLCVGTDAIAGLIEAARAGHPVTGTPACYEVVPYADVAAGALADRHAGVFDVIVCNFALFGAESVEALVTALPPLLAPAGHFVIQTLHPAAASTDAPYSDGWRDGSWAGFSSDFRDPAPWYFRTIGSWVALLHRCGFQLRALQEPVHPLTGAPASLLLVAAPRP